MLWAKNKTFMSSNVSTEKNSKSQKQQQSTALAFDDCNSVQSLQKRVQLLQHENKILSEQAKIIKAEYEVYYYFRN